MNDRKPIVLSLDNLEALAELELAGLDDGTVARIGRTFYQLMQARENSQESMRSVLVVLDDLALRGNEVRLLHSMNRPGAAPVLDPLSWIRQPGHSQEAWIRDLAAVEKMRLRLPCLPAWELEKARAGASCAGVREDDVVRQRARNKAARAQRRKNRR